jgi:hypothetical protein
MSLILDALRRSEDDVPGTLGRVPVAEPMRDPNKRWMFIVALLAGIAVGGVAVMIGSDTQKDPAPTVSNESVSTESASPYPPAGTPTASRAEGAGTDALAREDDSVAVIDLSAEHHATGEIGGGALDVGGAVDVKAANEGRIAELHRQMWSDAEQMPSELPVSSSLSESAPQPNQTLSETQDAASRSLAPPIDLATAMQQAARAAGESTLVPHPVALLENLSQQQKDRVPTIVYSDHVFAASDIASVELNGKRMLAGQQAGGIEVVEILTDSVILRAGGSEFRLRALNTWVNL